MSLAGDATSTRVTTPTDREITLRRSFDAPARLVFAAWTEPDLLVRWFGARGWNLVACEVDLRVGGTWRFVSRGPGGAEMTQSGVYREIETPGLLVHTESYDGAEHPDLTSLVTTRFVERAGRTTVTSTILHPSPEARDRTLRTPMERGLRESHARLDALLTSVGGLRAGVRPGPDGGSNIGIRQEGATRMNWTLEVVAMPVSDIDRSKKFYGEQMGFVVDHDTRVDGGPGIVQLTPRGSGCSIVLGVGLVEMEPGSMQGLQLVVRDIRAAREELLGRGVEVSEVQVPGPEGFRPAEEGEDLNNVGFAFFSDPDGNRWALQQISSRT
ncbi:SRPBCC domain-containing protein [Actinoalloteichus caeruleus]|uniref:Conserved protein YndB, AHSA1/START domain n=1 Tax=Actinoalloteichus caeruleus DSM 43889 TaxID=1120930 RepID=A0ABT1JF40_ACTCY|nr:SRPBCC domain-containing protein [Actinoalloteichus caeruleus]MCP2330793.1 putative conserved protein YndB, AHSA1/START domain [Actinoalloteichus caeruleus DSM 43889]